MERRTELDALVTTLDSKGNDLEQRLARFSTLLDQSLEGASDRARDIARLVAESTTGGARAIAENFEAIRNECRRGAQAHLRGDAQRLRAGDRRSRTPCWRKRPSASPR